MIEAPRTGHERAILNPVFDLRAFAKRIVVMGIDACDEPAEMKARIMWAYENKMLTAEEAEVLIVLRGLMEA